MEASKWLNVLAKKASILHTHTRYKQDLFQLHLFDHSYMQLNVEIFLPCRDPHHIHHPSNHRPLMLRHSLRPHHIHGMGVKTQDTVEMLFRIVSSHWRVVDHSSWFYRACISIAG